MSWVPVMALRAPDSTECLYRSQMGRGAGIKCIKCPLLSFMNGLKDLQSPVTRPSITVSTGWNLQHWPQGKKKTRGFCHKGYNFICQVVHHINTLSDENKKQRLEPRYKGLHIFTASHNTCSFPPGMLLQFNTFTPLLHSSHFPTFLSYELKWHLSHSGCMDLNAPPKKQRLLKCSIWHQRLKSGI